MSLTPKDQQRIAEFKAWLATLELPAHAEALAIISWTEKHFWPWTLATLVTGLVMGHYL